MPTQKAWLCRACEDGLSPFPHTICPSCGIRTLEGHLDETCKEKTSLTKFFCPYPLEQKAVRALVYTYKYRHATAIAPNIALLMHEWLVKQGWDLRVWMRCAKQPSTEPRRTQTYVEGDAQAATKQIAKRVSPTEFSLGSDVSSYIIVPVPLHINRFRERGFNQAEVLAKHLGESLGVPVCTDAIARIKPTPSQLEAQNKEARAKNMRDAFKTVRAEQIAGKKIILLDDVYTTGATMQACARALREADAREICGMAFARG